MYNPASVASQTPSRNHILLTTQVHERIRFSTSKIGRGRCCCCRRLRHRDTRHCPAPLHGRMRCLRFCKCQAQFSLQTHSQCLLPWEYYAGTHPHFSSPTSQYILGPVYVRARVSRANMVLGTVPIVQLKPRAPRSHHVTYVRACLVFVLENHNFHSKVIGSKNLFPATRI